MHIHIYVLYIMYYGCLSEEHLFDEGSVGQEKTPKKDVLCFQQKYKNQLHYAVVVLKLERI